MYRPIYILYGVVLAALVFEGFSFYQSFYHSYETIVQASVDRNLGLSEVANEEAASRSGVPDLKFLFVGDVMLSRLVGSKISAVDNPRYPFLKIASTTRVFDVLFGNLENPVSSRGENQGSIYSFRADPQVISGLSFAGFDIMSVANNHTWDWGSEALSDTVQYLKAAGIESVGAGRNESEANTPVILKRGDTRVAFLGYTNLMPKSLEASGTTPGLSHFDLDQIKATLKAIHTQADLVIISFHWGEEYMTEANASQKAIAHELIDAGADLVIGHHPHVVQGVEKYKNGWIAYSLGNFIFDQDFSPETMHGLGLVVEISQGKISGIQKKTVTIAHGQAAFLPS